MALWQLLLEQGLYKTIPKISLASSNWSSPLSAINTYCSSLFHPEFTLPFSPCCAIWEKLPQCFSEHCYSPCKCKEHTKCFSNAISVWYQELFMSPPHLKDAFIHISEENSCSRPHKYPMCSMLSCTSLSSRSFKLVHVTIYHWQYTTDNIPLLTTSDNAIVGIFSILFIWSHDTSTYRHNTSTYRQDSYTNRICSCLT